MASALLLPACSSAGTTDRASRPDDVGGSGTPASTSAPTPTPTADRTRPATTLASPLGAKWDWGRLDAFRPYLQQLSGTSTFFELTWCDLEKLPGQVDWSKVDRAAQQTRSLGIRLMLKIRVGRCALTGGGAAQHARGNKTESVLPTDLGAYATFVKSVVARYSPMGVTEYAIENEVNSPGGWGSTSADYIRLTNTAAAAIRSANPRAQVVDAGMSSTAYGYGIADDLLRRGKSDAAVAAYSAYFANRIGTRDRIPAVSTVDGLRAVLASDQGKRNLEYLAAARTLAERKVVDVRQVHFYEPWRNVPALLAYLHTQTPASVPLEAWEVGSFEKGGGVSPQDRSADLVRTLTLLLGGGVRKAIWLPLAFDPTGRNSDEPRYGLLEPNGAPRPAAGALASLVDATAGARVVPLPAGGLSGAAFEGGSGTTVVAWSSGAAVPVQLPAGTQVQPFDPNASASPAPATTTVNGAPVQLRSRGSAAALVGGLT